LRDGMQICILSPAELRLSSKTSSREYFKRYR
jgi:hypothetical protein